MKPIYATSENSSAESLTNSKVPAGINLVFYGLELTALALILMFALPFVASYVNIGLLMLIRIIQILIWAVIIGKIMGLIGKGLCLTAPDDMEGRSAIYIAVAMEVGSIVIDLLQAFALLNLPWLNTASSLLIILAFFFFLYFLKNLAVYMGSKELENGSADLINLMYVIIGVYVVMTVLPNVIQIGMVLLGISLVMLVLVILGLLRYSRLLLNFKRAFAAAS